MREVSEAAVVTQDLDMKYLKEKEILRARRENHNKMGLHFTWCLYATVEGLVLAVGTLVPDVPRPRPVCVYSQNLPEIGRRVKALW